MFETTRTWQAKINTLLLQNNIFSIGLIESFMSNVTETCRHCVQYIFITSIYPNKTKFVFKNIPPPHSFWPVSLKKAEKKNQRRLQELFH